MRRLYPVFFGLLLLVLTGCIAEKTSILPTMGTSDALSQYRERALSFEKKENLQKAIFWWQVILSLKPDDQDVRQKVASLQALARKKATDHVTKSREYAERDEWDKARLEAVIALRYDPRNPDALALLQQDPDMIRHTVQSEETPVSIAEKYFNDPGKARVIAYFNDLPSTIAKLPPGMILTFPSLPVLKRAQPQAATPEAPVVPEMPETNIQLLEAREIYKQKMYPKVVVLTEQILRQNPEDGEARLLLNKSCLALGREYLRKGEYGKAEPLLGQMTEGFPGLDEAMAELLKWKQEQAEEHYRQGVKHYINENLVGAIAEWQQTLELYPNHTRARENIEKAREIQERLKTME